MNDEKSIFDVASQSGWAIALLTGTWGVVLRFVVGRYARAADRLEDRLISMENRLRVIESRSHARRRDDDDDNE
jgi:hypothetical protein